MHRSSGAGVKASQLTWKHLEHVPIFKQLLFLWVLRAIHVSIPFPWDLVTWMLQQTIPGRHSQIPHP